MRTDKIIDAIGAIDEKFVEDAHRPQIKIKQNRRIKPLAVAAAAVLCAAVPLPLMTALGSDTAYNLLYIASPVVAQGFKPVQEVCVDSGIRMELISAEIEGDSAKFFIAMTDIGGVGLDETTDLYDSDWLKFRKDCTGHTSFSDFDPETKTAYFVTEMKTMDGSDFPKGKTTFGVRELIFGKESDQFVFDEIDLSDIPTVTETVSIDWFSGRSGGRDVGIPSDEYLGSLRYLPEGRISLASPYDGISLTGLGYIDGDLHIQTRYSDVFRHDNHGSCYLIGENGEKSDLIDLDPDSIFVTYWAEGSNGSPAEGENDDINEFVFHMDSDELSKYKLGGEFFHSNGYVKGDWEVTFKLK